MQPAPPLPEGQAQGHAHAACLLQSTAHHHPTHMQVSAQKKKCGFVSPRRFVGRVKAENALFSSFMHQVGGWRGGAGQSWGAAATA